MLCRTIISEHSSSEAFFSQQVIGHVGNKQTYKEGFCAFGDAKYSSVFIFGLIAIGLGRCVSSWRNCGAV